MRHTGYLCCQAGTSGKRSSKDSSWYTYEIVIVEKCTKYQPLTSLQGWYFLTFGIRRWTVAFPNIPHPPHLICYDQVNMQPNNIIAGNSANLWNDLHSYLCTYKKVTTVQGTKLKNLFAGLFQLIAFAQRADMVQYCTLQGVMVCW